MSTTLIVPGLRNSGPDHWQTWFERWLPDTRRVHQQNWDQPKLVDWGARVIEEIDDSEGPIWIVAHSFGCLASVTAALSRAERIHGAFLVAPADPARFGEPEALLEGKLSFPSLVVASSNDPWVSASVAERWAAEWGSRYLNIGNAGHINIDSEHGPWKDGLELFKQLRQEH